MPVLAGVFVKQKLLCTITAGTLLLCSACFSPLGKEEAGTITIDLGGASDRAAALDKWSPIQFPELFAVIEYRALFSGSGGTVTHTARGGSVITVAITPGTWNIEVQATVNGERYGRGTGSAEVKAGQANSARIQMSPWLYAIGDRGPGGGIIFYVAPAGFPVEGYTGATNVTSLTGAFSGYTAHYLEVAPSDSGTASWGTNLGTATIDVTTFPNASNALASQIGNGRKDTRIIIDAILDQGSTTIRAAQLAAAADFGGKDDWFLPSAGELKLLWGQRDIEGINLTGSSYMPSTSYDTSMNGWKFEISSGNLINVNKVDQQSVRAIRAF